jgi:hypothetical protein
MLGLVDRIEAALHDRPDCALNWRAQAGDLRRRLTFEAALAPAHVDGVPCP